MTNRPALRAAVVVSGLTLTGCGGTATLRDREPANDTTSTTGSSNDTSNDTTASGPSCDPNAEPTTAECCNQRGARTWDAATGTCLWTAVPGPFVPPSFLAPSARQGAPLHPPLDAPQASLSRALLG